MKRAICRLLIARRHRRNYRVGADLAGWPPDISDSATRVETTSE